MKKCFIRKIFTLSLIAMSLTTVTASAGTAISSWYGSGRNVVSSHNCSGWSASHEVGVIRTPATFYTSGLSWVSYSRYVGVQTTVQVGHQFSFPANGTGYAQTSTVTDLPGMPVSEVHL